MLAIISKRLCLLKTTRLVSKDPRIDFLPQLPHPCLHFPFQIYPWRGGGKGKECIQKSASSPNPGKHYTKPLNNLRKEQDSQFPKTVLTFLFFSLLLIFRLSLPTPHPQHTPHLFYRQPEHCLLTSCSRTSVIISKRYRSDILSQIIESQG